jgi:Flp pilus assembly protein TadD
MPPSEKKLSRSQRVELAFLEAVRGRCPGNTHVLRALGDSYTSLRRYQEGLDIDEELTRLCPADSEVWYNLGCSYALVGRTDDAFRALGRAVELGYEDTDWMERDADLESLRTDPRFSSLMRRATSKLQGDQQLLS